MQVGKGQNIENYPFIAKLFKLPICPLLFANLPYLPLAHLPLALC